MNTNNKISKLFFEWNELKHELALPFYTQLALSPTLEYLILRSNSIDDSLIIPFIEKLNETNNQSLKMLDLYDNLLTKKCIFSFFQQEFFYYKHLMHWESFWSQIER